MTPSIEKTYEQTIQTDGPDSPMSLRDACRGTSPLTGRLESWMTDAIADPEDRQTMLRTLDRYGSPTHFLNPQPMLRRAESWTTEAHSRGLDFQIYFARKANKALCFVDAALSGGLGIDTASDPEVAQTLDRDFPPKRMICTAAIKNSDLIRRCISSGVTIAIDNLDEWHGVRSVCRDSGARASVAIRLSGFTHQGSKLHSRFGIDVNDFAAFVNNELTLGHGASDADATAEEAVEVVGLHFHLDGYDSAQRVSAVKECLPWVGRLRALGHRVSFIDIGGGVPMSYLEDEDQWHQFWRAHAASLLDPAAPAITHRHHALGRRIVNDRVEGKPNVYPFFQRPVGVRWWQQVWDADLPSDEGRSATTVAEAFAELDLQMRCEPGRSLLDGCGMTAASVRFRKPHPDGFHYIGLEMNRTQCRTTTDDFLVDPILVRRNSETHDAMSGYFVGAYCTESELISLRRIELPMGCEVGDVVIFPNTAGYLMHFLESRSHQFPLAANVVLHHAPDDLDRQSWRRDPIDEMTAGR